MVRTLGVIAASLAALNVFLLGYPGDLVPQSYLVVVGAANAAVGAAVAYLAKTE